MHTRDDLTTADFTLAIDGREATFADLLPGLTVDSRVAIVARSPAGAFGAATTLLGLVTHWYAERARRSADFFEYPDYYYLQVAGGGTADLGALEIWPPHKRVLVAPRAQDLLEAITDRAVDYLLLEERVPGSAPVLRETRDALPRHLRAVVAYGAGGEAADADVVVHGSAAAEDHIRKAIAASAEVTAALRESTRQMRARRSQDGRAEAVFPRPTRR